MKKIPNPGTKEAIEQGCMCPVLDNEYGEGYMHQKGVFCYVEGCPLHDTLKWSKEQNDANRQGKTIKGSTDR